MKKNNLYFLKMSTFLSRLFCHVGKRLDKKAKVNYKSYEIKDWTENNYNKHIAKYFKK